MQPGHTFVRKRVCGCCPSCVHQMQRAPRTTCSPSSAHLEETLSTLSYATRAKNIQNRPTIQYDPDEEQAASYRREIGLLRQVRGLLRRRRSWLSCAGVAGNENAQTAVWVTAWASQLAV